MPGDRSMADFNTTPVVTPLGHNQTLFIVGDQPTGAGGRMTFSWQVQVRIAGYPQPVAAVTTQSPPPGYAEHVITYTDGLSNEIPLDGSPLLARFYEAGIDDGTTWLVNCLAIPTRDPGQVAIDFSTAGAAVLSKLFGFAPQEPYRTWRNLWWSDQPLPYRLGAVLLAVAARTDEIRRGSS